MQVSIQALRTGPGKGARVPVPPSQADKGLKALADGPRRVAWASARRATAHERGVSTGTPSGCPCHPNRDDSGTRELSTSPGGALSGRSLDRLARVTFFAP